MRKIYSFMLLAVAAVAFSSCNKEEIRSNTPDEVKFKVTVNAESLDTKAHFGAIDGTSYPVLWDSQAALFSLDGATAVSATATPSSDNSTASFEVEFTTDPISTGGVIYSASPAGNYQSSPVVGGATSIRSTYAYYVVPTSQKPSDSSVDPTALAVFGSTTYTSSVPSEIKMDYKHVLAYGKMTISNFEHEIASVSIKFPVAVAGTAIKYYHTTDGEQPAGSYSGAISDCITLDPSDLTGNTFWFGCLPTGAMTSGDMIIDVTDKDGAVYEKTISFSSAKSLSFVRGEVSKFTVNMEGVVSDPSICFVSGTDKGTTTSTEADSMTKSGVIIAGTSAALAATEYRFYANSTITITSEEKGISKVEFILPSANTKGDASGISATSGYSVNADKTIGTWEGTPVQTLSFKVGNSQVRFGRIKVYLSDESGTPAPVISPVANPDEVSADGGVVTIEYSVTNPVEGVSISASSDKDWVNTFDYSTDGEISFVVDENTGAARTATVTLSYEGADNVVFTVSQAAAEAAAANITITLDFSQNIFELSNATSNAAESETSFEYGDYSYLVCASTSFYYYGSKATMIGKAGSYITFPAISGYKLKSIKVSNCTGASANASCVICPTDSADAITGGEASTIAAGGSTTWTTTGAQTNTAYRFYITNKYAVQLTEVVLEYTPAS